MNWLIENNIDTFVPIKAEDDVILLAFLLAFIKLAITPTTSSIVCISLANNCLLIGNVNILNPCIFIHPREQLVEGCRLLSGQGIVNYMIQPNLKFNSTKENSEFLNKGLIMLMCKDWA